MLGYVFQQCFEVLKKKPFRLLGLSLSSGLLILLTKSFFSLFPIIWMPISFVVTCGMALVYLDGYKGREVNTDQLFSGFQSVRLFLHTACGMGWRALWLILWGLVPVGGIAIAMYMGVSSMVSYFIRNISSMMNPFGSYYPSYSSFGNPNYLLIIISFIIGIAGIVIYLMMYYAYSFTPYILLSDSEVSATEAIRISAEKTKGHRGTLFLADFLVNIILFIILLMLFLLSLIPFIGAVFSTLLIIVSVASMIFLPLFKGLYRAGFYDVINNNPSGYRPTPTPSRNIPPYPPTPNGGTYSTPPVEVKQPVYEEPAVYTEPPVNEEPPVNPNLSFLDDEKTQIPTDTDLLEPNASPQSHGFCTKCGAPLKPGQRFCTKCGTPVN